MEKLLFYFVGGVSIITSLLAISRRQPVFGVLYLFLTGLSVSVLFALKNAFFLALIQIIVYIGAVLVLFVFVIAMMNLRPYELVFGAVKRWRFVIIPLAFIVFAILGSAIFSETSLKETKFKFFPAKDVGGELYKTLVFQFEYLSILLITAIVITVFVGMRIEKGRR